MRVAFRINFFGYPRPSAFVIVTLLVLAVCTGISVPLHRDEASPAEFTAQLNWQHVSPAGEAALRSWIDAGNLLDLRWPNFSDYRLHLRNFYQPAGYALAWIRNGQPTPQAVTITGAFLQADGKGLNSEDYDSSRWPGRITRLQLSDSGASKSELVKFDLAVTVCTMRYISDLHIGKVNPRTFHFGLDIEGKKYNLPVFLRQRLIGVDPQSVKTVLAEVEPPFAGYRRTQRALQIYEDLARKDDGEQMPVPKKPIKPGDVYSGIPRLVRLLRLIGDLPADTSIGMGQQVYQPILAEAVRRFQVRHGLDTTGLLDPGTVKQLNIPLTRRVEQFHLTLERWRWVPHEFPRPPVVVNIPEFRLRALNEQYGTALAMKVVVGRSYRHQTPVFAKDMRFVLFRPYWNVPLSIQRAELVPKLQKDRSYLASHDYQVVDHSGNVINEALPTDDMLGQLRSGRLEIRQKPGPQNALGLIKFLFPNEYNVYLHSTPSVELFSRSRRDFSHGCIRVEDPAGLAAWVLRDRAEWTPDRIRSVMNGDQTVQVALQNTIPVLIVYGTVFVEENGEVRFFEDIYGHDAALERVLAAGYPYPG